MPEFTGHRDIRSYIRAIWRWKLLIIVLVVGGPLVAFLLEHGKPKQYSASATVSLTSGGSLNTTAVGGTIFQTSNIAAIAQLITTDSVATIAGADLKPPQSAGVAVSGVSAAADVTTNFITITAVKASPGDAAAVANAFAHALNTDGSRAAKKALKNAIKTTKAQLAHVSRTSANYGTLQANLQTYEQQRAAPNNVASLVQPASPDDTPTGPHPRRAVELGLVIGILLAIAAVMLLDSADRRLRSPDDLEEFTKLPLLAAVAPSAFEDGLETTPMDDEAFQTLRTSLTYFTVDQPIRSVLITSPGEQEGKSTVAVRLALASARAGLDVVLVDGDLRRAGATAKLGLKANVGLGLVLAEQRPVQAALADWPLGPDDVGRLRVLAAGSPPPNPAALISSAAMRDLIATLEHQADLVLIDTPAALAVSDAVPLLQSVSGVVLVARMNRSSRDTVRRLQKIIASAHGNLLGTVATGVTAGPGYEKYSHEYYSPAGTASRRGRRRRRRGSEQPPASVALSRVDDRSEPTASTNGSGTAATDVERAATDRHP
ncbi:MAG: polysaccharide biosynthesis tyrosine autokinase [Solirubrobacteraceae bacterium]